MYCHLQWESNNGESILSWICAHIKQLLLAYSHIPSNHVGKNWTTHLYWLDSHLPTYIGCGRKLYAHTYIFPATLSNHDYCEDFPLQYHFTCTDMTIAQHVHDRKTGHVLSSDIFFEWKYFISMLISHSILKVGLPERKASSINTVKKKQIDFSRESMGVSL